MTIRASFQAQLGAFHLNADFDAPSTGITALFGRSGSGKTTVLRSIAGLCKETRGFLCVNHDVWLDSKGGVCIPPHRRPIGYVFQEASLFPHLSVRKNLLYGLSRTRIEITSAAFDQLVTLLGIDHLLDRGPHELSGGERQRAAIARSLLTSPKLLLLDEPMSGLDAARKNEIFPYLERLRTEMRIPMFYVSHSLHEVNRLADHVVLIENGKIQASGPKDKMLGVLGGKGPLALSFVADSGTGKTTLIEALLRELKTRGYRVGAVKHDAHKFEIDHAGKDSYRFTHAGADTTVIASDTKVALVSRLAQPLRVEEIIERHFQDVDLVLTEGFKASSLPKVLLFRSDLSTDLRSLKNRVEGEFVAIATNSPQDALLDEGVPVLDLNQPQLIANFIEEKFFNKKPKA